jgi:hypothetical protein
METHKIHYLFTNLFQLIMKTFICSIFSLIFISASAKNITFETDHFNEYPASIKTDSSIPDNYNNIRIRVTVKFTGTPQRNRPECEKFGTNCLGADIIISINPGVEPPRLANEVVFTNNNNSTLTLEVMHTPDMNDEFFVVDENFIFSSKLRDALKIKQTHIPKGKYKITSVVNGVVSVTVPVK